MDNELLDLLLEQIKPKLIRWGLVRGQLRINKVLVVRGYKPSELTDRELELVLRLLEQDRIIAKLQKPKRKAKAKKKAKKKA